jgi:large subunit ribosomal protein L6
MSRVGRKPILIPAGVEVNLAGQEITVKGPKGSLSFKISSDIEAKIDGDKIEFSLREPDKNRGKLTSSQLKRIRSAWGLCRSVTLSLIEGVVKGFVKKLEIEGLGYRASVENGDLNLLIGYSHPVKIKKVSGIDFSVEKNIITISGTDKALVGQMAAKIRQLKAPDPYKGKGIRYLGEIIKKKAGKKAAGATTGK